MAYFRVGTQRDSDAELPFHGGGESAGDRILLLVQLEGADVALALLHHSPCWKTCSVPFEPLLSLKKMVPRHDG